MSRVSRRVDESSMTGEPLPREKKPGDLILAGTLNHNGVIEAEVVKVGEDTTLGRSDRSDRGGRKSPAGGGSLDRPLRPLVHAGHPELRRVGLGDYRQPGPGRGRAHRRLSLRPDSGRSHGHGGRPGPGPPGAASWSRAETFWRKRLEIDTVFFDKTGTLTMGEPRVEEVACDQGLQEEEVLSFAASAEQNSNHPLGRAVLKAAHYSKVILKKADEVFSEIGLGVRATIGGSLIEVGSVNFGGGVMALPVGLRTSTEKLLEQGKTPLVVFRDHIPVGILGISDRVRPAALTVVNELKSLGVNRVAVLSGDQQNAVKNLAGQIGAVLYYAEQRPQDKLDVIKQHQEEGRRIMYVGDGINDGPSLAASDLGVAMGAAGSDVALETADIALIHDDIAKLPFLVKLGRRMVAIIKINIFFGLAFNAAAVLASGWGLLNPIMAALVHNIGSILVVMSSASLVFYKEGPGSRKKV